MFETWKVLKSCKQGHFIDALYWLLISSIGGLLPLWGLFILLPLSNQDITLNAFAKNGELALYSASFASASLYLITKDNSKRNQETSDQDDRLQPKKKDFPAKPMYQLSFSTILAATCIIFSFMTFVHMPDSNTPINIEFLVTLSLIVFLISLFLSYISAVVDNYLTTYQVEEEIRISRAQDLDDVSKKFESLGKG